MFFFAAIITCVFFPFLLWLFIIRPYCIRHGKGYTPGANWAVSIWINWQEALDLAKVHDDRGIRNVCHLFLSLQIAFAIIMVLMFAGVLPLR